MIGRKFAYEGAQKEEREARGRLESITDEFLADYQRFKADKAVDMRAILLKYANLQLVLCEKTERLGQGVLPRLAEKSAPQTATERVDDERAHPNSVVHPEPPPPPAPTEEPPTKESSAPEVSSAISAATEEPIAAADDI